MRLYGIQNKIRMYGMVEMILIKEHIDIYLFSQ